MSAFWKHLHGLAQAQLFNGGYVAPAAAAAMAARECAARKDSQSCRHASARRGPWPRLAAFR